MGVLNAYPYLKTTELKHHQYYRGTGYETKEKFNRENGRVVETRRKEICEKENTSRSPKTLSVSGGIYLNGAMFLTKLCVVIVHVYTTKYMHTYIHHLCMYIILFVYVHLKKIKTSKNDFLLESK